MNIILKESVLLFAFFFCVGFAGRAEAIDLVFPTSIHEILQPEQLEKIKTGNALKDVQQGKGRKVMKKQRDASMPAMKKMMGMRLGNIMNSKLSAQVEKKMSLKSEKIDSEPTVQATSTP
ncbi:hypothetical protein KKHLCK_09605 [Candidatus Electrothrix laxa]